MKKPYAALRIAFLFVLIATIAPLLLAQARPSLITQPVNDHVRVTLKGNVLPLARAQFDQGAVAASQPTGTMILLLGRSTRTQASLDNYIHGLSNPSSPDYGKWLTPAQFGERFGAAGGDIQIVTGWLKAHGFAVRKVSPGADFIQFSGTMGEVKAAFGTEVHKYVINGVTHLANATNPQIPAALAPLVRGITSLNDIHPQSQLVRAPARPASTKSGGGIQPNYTIYGPSPWGPKNYDVYYLPDAADAAIMYDTPNRAMNTAYAGTTWDGAGISVGIAGDSNLPPAILQDVTNYRTFFLDETPDQAKQFIPRIVVDGEDPGLNGDALEAVLDLEMVEALAPGAQTTLYTAQSTVFQQGLFLAMERAVDDNSVSILNVSFGECEQYLGASANAFLNELYEQAAAQGISVVVAAGDSGSAGCDSATLSMSGAGAAEGLAVNGLASTPWNVAVGGTDFPAMFGDPSNYVKVPSNPVGVAGTGPYLASALGYIPEEPWNDSTSTFNDYANNTVYHFGGGPTNTLAGGGGKSSQAVCSGTVSASTGECSGTLTGYSKPAFQSSATTADGVRDVPDVSFFAGAFMGDEGDSQDFNNAWAICADSILDDYDPNIQYDCTGTNPVDAGITPVGGTSAAAPLMAGVLAMVSQSQGGKRLGQVDPVLYNLYANYPSTFHDVTEGNNSVLCNAGTPDCGSNGFSNGYNAGPGYDYATGLGSIDVAQLVANWSHVAYTPTTTTLQIGTSAGSLSTAGLTISHGTPVYISAGVNPSNASGDIALTTDSTQADSGSLGFATLKNGGVSFSTTALPGGSYTLYANYGGDATNAASTSQGIPVTISSEPSSLNVSFIAFDPTTLAAKTGATSVPYGQYLFLEVTPYGTASGQGKSNPATGTVTATMSGPVIPSTTLGPAGVSSEGTAEIALDTGNVYPGADSFAVQYSGDGSYTAAQAKLGLTVTKAPVTTTPLLYDCGSYSPGKVTCLPLITLNTDSIGAPFSGTATFSLNGTVIYSQAVISAPGTGGLQQLPVNSGSSIDVSKLLGVGDTGTMTFSYSGDSNYEAVAPITATFTIPEPTDAAIALSNSGAVTAAAGSQGTSTVTVTPANGFGGPVTLACSITSAPAAAVNQPTCSIAKSVEVQGTTPQTATLTISTTAPTSARSNPAGPFGRGSGIAFACLLIGGLAGRRKAWRRYLGLVVLAVALVSIPMIGCSGGSVGPAPGSGGGGTSSAAGTTAGTYTVTVTGTHDSIQSSTPVTLTVQ